MQKNLNRRYKLKNPKILKSDDIIKFLTQASDDVKLFIKSFILKKKSFHNQEVAFKKLTSLEKDREFNETFTFRAPWVEASSREKLEVRISTVT